MDHHVRAVAMDVDGTLASADHRPSPRTVRIVRRLAVSGPTPIIVTGRTEQAALGLARSLGLTAPVVSSNGAVVTDPSTGERLQVHRFERSLAERVLRAAAAADLQPMLFAPDRPWTDRESRYTDLLSDLLEQRLEVGPLTEVLDRTGAVKVMLAGPPRRLDAVAPQLQREFPGLCRSMPPFLEAAPPGAGKQAALALVLSTLGIPPADCVGIGDGENDVDWLRWVGRCVAVANARPEVLAIADEVIGHHDHEGVAEYLERFLLDE